MVPSWPTPRLRLGRRKVYSTRYESESVCYLYHITIIRLTRKYTRPITYCNNGMKAYCRYSFVLMQNVMDWKIYLHSFYFK